MRIEEMTRDMSLHLLSNVGIGRIACAKDLQPYVTPFAFGYHDRCIYGFTTVGRKIEWMRANPLVCVEVEGIVSREEWQTVVIFGRYEELPDIPELQNARVIAHSVISKTAAWWEPGYAKTLLGKSEQPRDPVWFRILIDEISGRQGIPDRPIRPHESTIMSAWRIVSGYFRG